MIFHLPLFRFQGKRTNLSKCKCWKALITNSMLKRQRSGRSDREVNPGFVYLV
uniref:Uncharacterized protein n=1 Tax=Utricularia reniformis TaxID=192314 RepID=A0A1Y0AZG7_9LAMI|nr:hypothetical protein AEK19_MT0300 [Utricularia reniformis]ART30576.1 hypothetical protein AEK19_MT0300 [Utricularia reniformis]